MELRLYRTKHRAQLVADKLNRLHAHSGRKFTVEQHPYTWGLGIKTVDTIGRVAWVTKGPLTPATRLGFNARGVA